MLSAGPRLFRWDRSFPNRAQNGSGTRFSFSRRVVTISPSMPHGAVALCQEHDIFTEILWMPSTSIGVVSRGVICRAPK